MEQYIPKSVLVAEIKKKIKQYRNERNTIIKNTDNSKELLRRIYICEDILLFINKIEVKEVDLKEDVDRILYENDWDYEIDFYEFAKHFFELGLAQKDLTLSNYDKAMITTITNALNYIEELNDSKGHDNVPSQYQSEKDWLKSLKQRFTWKPSKEQIRALRWVLNNIPYNTHKEEISGLLEQIKDL